jgi:hypothetical protein
MQSPGYKVFCQLHEMDVFDLDPTDNDALTEVAGNLQRAWYSNKTVKEVRHELLKLVSNRAEHLTIVARLKNGQIVGSLSIDMRRGGRLYASNLYVRSSERNRGIGTLLSGYGLERGRNYFQTTQAYAETAPDAPPWLIMFYESIGFLCIESRPNGSRLFVIHI